MQIFETLIALRGGGVQLLQAEQAANVSEDILTLVSKRIADHGGNIIDRQAGRALPDTVQ
jgi:hypothetical protein